MNGLKQFFSSINIGANVHMLHTRRTFSSNANALVKTFDAALKSMREHHRIIQFKTLSNNLDIKRKYLRAHTLPLELVSTIEKLYNVSIKHEFHDITPPSKTNSNKKMDKDDTHIKPKKKAFNSYIIVTSNTKTDNQLEQVNISLTKSEELIKFIVQV